jgi:predicted nuclease of predicted toxin-antitoxin system
VRLLLDENLSRRLVERLADLFPGSIHVASEGLLQAADARLWAYAKVGGFAIATADADYPTAVAERLIGRQAIRVAEFLQDREQAVLILTP